MAYEAYLLENEILVLSWVGAFAPYFNALLWGVLYERLGASWGICSSPKQNDKCPTNAQVEGGGGWGEGDSHAWN